jgi:hypothetical protein
MVFMAVWGYVNGEISTLLAPVDGDGRLCGVGNATSNATQGYPNLWIADISTAALHPTSMFKYAVCVKTCPTETGVSVACVPTQEESTCADPLLAYPTTEVMNYCLPIYD